MTPTPLQADAHALQTLQHCHEALVRIERSGHPALMAQAAGVPIIAEADAPLDGLVEHDRTGLTFPPGQLNVGCDRLVRLHDDRVLAKRLTDAAREQAVRGYSIQTLCERLETAYHQAIDERRSAYLELTGTG